MFECTREEREIFKKLSTPGKIQDFLDRLPINHEKKRETCFSPRQVLRERKAHCIEGALLAAIALWIHGGKTLLLDLKTGFGDDDHVVAIFRWRGYYGAISKTNHGVLRYRDPIYRTPRELALSYFHEYFLPSSGKKTLLSYSAPFSLERYGFEWVTSEEDVWYIAEDLDVSRHFSILPRNAQRILRKASVFERDVAKRSEWKKQHPGT